jgi:hypothetical protein
MERFVMERRQCIHCRTRFTPLRNPNQYYCSKPACQKKRRYRYKRKKLKSDADYKDNQREAQRRWSKTHPEYWKKYRARKPGYVKANRLAQQGRNGHRSCQKAQAEPSEVIAKITPLIPETLYLSVCYQLVLHGFDVIAKRVRYRQEEDGLLMSSI